MPQGLDIDYKRPLHGLIPAYAHHVVIATGKDDWSSKIEDEEGGENLANYLKELVGAGKSGKIQRLNAAVGMGGEFYDVGLSIVCC